MFSNKLLNISIIIIIAIMFLGVSAFFLYQYIFPTTTTQEVKESIDDILPLTVNVPKINTNLGDSSIIVLELTLQASNKDAKEEAEKRMFQIKDRINLYLKNLTSDSFETEKSINEFKKNLIGRLNTILQTGKIESIDITQIFLQ